MSNVQGRPFGGTWKLNNRSVIKYTPDALVYINGDTSVPGCPRCRGRIDIMQYVTGMNVEAGTDPTSHSASIQLSLPRMQGQQLFVDGYNLLRPGLEVHIFMRGFFPMRGLFSHLSNSQTGSEGGAGGNRMDMSKYATYPYYPVFHGLVSQVNYEYSDGFYHGSLTCTSLLSFWQHVNMTTSGAWLGQDAKPENDQGRTTVYGNNFNNMNPFSVMYTLYKDVAGSAAGLEFALDGASNMDAVSASRNDDGQQLFDMVSIYWEQRFKTRIQNMRMYGVNGQLYNAAQQAWLGKNRDLSGLLTSSTANDPTTQSTEKDPFSSRLSVAKALGLAGAGADFTFSPLLTSNNEFFNLSIMDMYAFNLNAGDIGNLSKWVSTYETKMDIAQRVMDVTGYEFFQDVDGDLVFKPPFWNLDTSTNRYYRLEDSDIINITFTEKEPRATYIIVRGAWIEGIQGVVPNKDALNKRGLYIDYKLVAKFGWRAAPAMDLTYVSDPKVLFWIGVARLDILNVDTFSATATIPIRAELRPGYPVYIPFVDSYYYIRQFSHGFSFGGQCTTSLVLTCRRSKWHAPGYLEPASPGSSAIDKIRLDRPDLPPRPLEIMVNDVPRYVGFPNVVMALDPRKFNPNYSVVGVGFEHFESVDGPGDMLYSLIVRDIHLVRAFKIETNAPGVDREVRDQDPTLITSLRLTVDDKDDIIFTVDQLRKSFKALAQAGLSYDEAKAKVAEAEGIVIEQEASAAVGNLEARQQGRASADPTDPNPFNLGAAAQRFAMNERDQRAAAFSSELVKRKETIETGPISLLVAVWEALQPDANRPISRKIDGIPGADVRLSYFQTLSHLKSQYMASSVPGYYRYFSCSHPFESQQGMPIITWDDGKRAKEGSKSTGSTPSRSSQPQRSSAPVGSQPILSSMLQTLIAATDQLPGIERWFDPNIQDTEFKKWAGQTKARKATSDALLDNEMAQRIFDITSVANTIVQEVLDHKDYKDAVIESNGYVLSNPKLYSGFRPSSEPASAEAYHTAGVAIDITWAKGGRDLAKSEGVTAPWLKAIVVVRTVVAQAYKDGLIQGMGFYIDDPPGGTFTHIDMRGNKAAQKQLKDQRVALREAYLDKPPRAFPPTKSLKKRKKFFTNIGLSDPEGLVDTPDKNEAPGPKKRWKGVPAFDSDDDDAALPWESYVEGMLPWVRAQPPVDQIPIGAAPAEPPPPEDSNQTPPETEPQPEPLVRERPRIDTQALSLEVARKVVQFQTHTESSGGGRRAPEVILGIGNCSKGIPLAQGPNRTPQVVTTDQIQRIGFIRHQAGKFTQVAGTAQSSGSVNTFAGTALIRQIADAFVRAAKDVDYTKTTVSEVWEDMYVQISTDLATVPIPVYDGVDPTTVVAMTNIALRGFPDLLIISAEEVDDAVEEDWAQQGVQRESGFSDEGELTADDFLLSQYSVSDLTFSQLMQVDKYAASSEGGTVSKVASAYANKIVETIEKGNNITRGLDPANAAVPDVTRWVGYVALQNAAFEPTSNRQERMDAIRDAVNKATTKAFDYNVAQKVIVPNKTEEKGIKEGKVMVPIHSPVFPVSDEKGYEHYGAYRYGRGLTVDPGGSWEFIHSGQDPFKNVTAQSAEEFLRVFTLVNTGDLPPLGVQGTKKYILNGYNDAVSTATQFILGQRQEALGDEGPSDTPEDPVEKAHLSELDRDQVEKSVRDLASTIANLQDTSRGNEALRELLRANGDDPDLVNQPGFDITDTQFFNNFVNYAVNFGKSAVFKTTVANAAYRLTDLTTHLKARMGAACICHGNLASIDMEAYSRESFDTVEGIDTATDKAEAYAGEIAKGTQGTHQTQEQKVRGELITEPLGGADEFNGGRTTGAGTSGVLSPDAEGAVVTGDEDSENPGETADPSKLITKEPVNPVDLGFSSTAEALEVLAAGGVDTDAFNLQAELEFVQDSLAVAPGELEALLNGDIEFMGLSGPEGIRAFVASREFGGFESVALDPEFRREFRESLGDNPDDLSQDIRFTDGTGATIPDGHLLPKSWINQHRALEASFNTNRQLGITAEEVLALLYLASSPIVEIPPGTEAP